MLVSVQQQLLFDRDQGYGRGLDDGLFYLAAIHGNTVDLAQTAVVARAMVLFVVIAPASALVPFEGIAIVTIAVRTATHLPARNQRVDMLYSFDTEFQIFDGIANAPQSLDVRLGVPSLIRF